MQGATVRSANVKSVSVSRSNEIESLHCEINRALMSLAVFIKLMCFRALSIASYFVA